MLIPRTESSLLILLLLLLILSSDLESIPGLLNEKSCSCKSQPLVSSLSISSSLLLLISSTITSPLFHHHYLIPLISSHHPLPYPSQFISPLLLHPFPLLLPHLLYLFILLLLLPYPLLALYHSYLINHSTAPTTVTPTNIIAAHVTTTPSSSATFLLQPPFLATSHSPSQKPSLPLPPHVLHHKTNPTLHFFLLFNPSYCIMLPLPSLQPNLPISHPSSNLLSNLLLSHLAPSFHYNAPFPSSR